MERAGIAKLVLVMLVLLSSYTSNFGNEYRFKPGVCMIDSPALDTIIVLHIEFENHLNLLGGKPYSYASMNRESAK